MGISDAKRLVGTVCSIAWQDRSGAMQTTVSKIHDVIYVPMYGGYLVTDTYDIPLEKLTHIFTVEDGDDRAIAA